MDRDLAVGIDIGGTDIKGAVIDRAGKVLTRGKRPTGAGTGFAAVLGAIKGVITDVLQDQDRARLAGIGVGVPGSVDTRAGIIKGGISNVPELNGARLADELGKDFSVPVLLDNDATNAAKGEFRFGAGKGCRNMLMITVGTGVGGGLILNGDVYHGASDYAGEIGHMIVVPSGRPCSCGNYGCLEAYSSGTAMVSYARWKNHKGVKSALSDYRDEQITPKLIEDLAQAGDRSCREILHHAGKYLGIALASLTNILNLERCLIGGGVAQAGDYFFDPLYSYYGTYVLPEAANHCTIVKAELMNDAGIYGSAATVFMNND